MVTGNNIATNKNRAISLISGLCLFAAGVCFIVNYAIDQKLTWSLFPAGGLAVLWAAIAPLLLLSKNRDLGVFAGLSSTIIAYLFLIQYLVPAKGWVLPLALPVALIALTAFGVSLMLFTRSKINKLYSAAITVFLFGVVVNFFTERIVDNYTGNARPGVINRFTIITTLAIVFLLFIAGYITANRTRRTI